MTPSSRRTAAALLALLTPALAACDSGAACTSGDIAASAVPAAVVAALAAEVPSPGAVVWTLEEADYEAAFTAGSVKTAVVISPAGVVRSVETDTPVADLPPAVRAAVARDYAGYTVTAAARIAERSPAAVHYEAQLERGAEMFDLIYDASATLLERIDAADGCD